MCSVELPHAFTVKENIERQLPWWNKFNIIFIFLLFVNLIAIVAYSITNCEILLFNLFRLSLVIKQFFFRSNST